MDNKKKLNDLRNKIKNKTKEIEFLNEKIEKRIAEISVSTELSEIKENKKKREEKKG